MGLSHSELARFSSVHPCFESGCATVGVSAAAGAYATEWASDASAGPLNPCALAEVVAESAGNLEDAPSYCSAAHYYC